MFTPQALVVELARFALGRGRLSALTPATLALAIGVPFAKEEVLLVIRGSLGQHVVSAGDKTQVRIAADGLVEELEPSLNEREDSLGGPGSVANHWDIPVVVDR